MNMLHKFFKHYIGSNNTEENVRIGVKNWGIMTLIIISTTLLFPYNEWATNILLSIQLTEFFGAIFPDTLNLIEYSYNNRVNNEINISADRYVVASVYARLLVLSLVSIHFCRRWKHNINVCQQIAIEYLEHKKEFKNVKKTVVIILLMMLICTHGFHYSFFESTFRTRESIDYLNFIDIWEIACFSIIYLYTFLKSLIFLCIVFFKQSKSPVLN